MATFSSDEQRCLERDVNKVDVSVTPLSNVREVYEIEKCEDWIKKNNISKVCLQFPDQLLCDSPDVALAIERSLGCDCFILGDTSYGSCCVDEVSAEHVNAEGIIHFGHACLSPTRRLPVLYIFQSKPLCVPTLITAVSANFEDHDSRLLLVFDVAYTHMIGEVQQKLSQEYPHTVSAVPALDSKDKLGIRCLGCVYQLPHGTVIADYHFVYIGEDGRTFTNFLIELAECRPFLYNPQQPEKSVQFMDGRMSISKFLMKRLYLVERVKDASTLGIIIGTLGVADYLEAVDRIKLLAKRAIKKTYIISVGCPNVAKLANFPEIDVFVLVACPENTLLDSKEYYKPIVSLYEVEQACNPGRPWQVKYTLDYRQFLSDGCDHINLDEDVSEPVEDVSLITGKMRTIDVGSNKTDSEQSSLVQRPGMPVSISTGSNFLANRSWQGLVQKLGETPVVIAQKGRSGIASQYSSEPIQKK